MGRLVNFLLLRLYEVSFCVELEYLLKQGSQRVARQVGHLSYKCRFGHNPDRSVEYQKGTHLSDHCHVWPQTQKKCWIYPNLRPRKKINKTHTNRYSSQGDSCRISFVHFVSFNCKKKLDSGWIWAKGSQEMAWQVGNCLSIARQKSCVQNVPPSKSLKEKMSRASCGPFFSGSNFHIHVFLKCHGFNQGFLMTILGIRYTI